LEQPPSSGGYVGNNPVNWIDPWGLSASYGQGQGNQSKWINNRDGTYTAQKGATLWGLQQQTGKSWQSFGYSGNPKNLQPGDIVGHKRSPDSSTAGKPPANFLAPWEPSASGGKKNEEATKSSHNIISFSRGIGVKLALLLGGGVEMGIIVDKNLNVYFYASGSIGTGIQTPAVKTPLSTKDYLFNARGQSTSISLDPSHIGFSSSTTVDIGLGITGTYDLNNLNKSGLPNSYGYGSAGGGVWKNGTIVIPLYKGNN